MNDNSDPELKWHVTFEGVTRAAATFDWEQINELVTIGDDDNTDAPTATLELHVGPTVDSELRTKNVIHGAYESTLRRALLGCAKPWQAGDESFEKWVTEHTTCSYCSGDGSCVEIATSALSGRGAQITGHAVFNATTFS